MYSKMFCEISKYVHRKNAAVWYYYFQRHGELGIKNMLTVFSCQITTRKSRCRIFLSIGSFLTQKNSLYCSIANLFLAKPIRGRSQTTFTRFTFFWPPTPPPLVNVVYERPLTFRPNCWNFCKLILICLLLNLSKSKICLMCKIGLFLAFFKCQ